MTELTEAQQGLANNIGTEICGYCVDDVKAVFSHILGEMERDGRNRFM
jgi:hypothetical protein